MKTDQRGFEEEVFMYFCVKQMTVVLHQEKQILQRDRPSLNMKIHFLHNCKLLLVLLLCFMTSYNTRHTSQSSTQMLQQWQMESLSFLAELHQKWKNVETESERKNKDSLDRASGGLFHVVKRSRKRPNAGTHLAYVQKYTTVPSPAEENLLHTQSKKNLPSASGCSPPAANKQNWGKDSGPSTTETSVQTRTNRHKERLHPVCFLLCLFRDFFSPLRKQSADMLVILQWHAASVSKPLKCLESMTGRQRAPRSQQHLHIFIENEQNMQ